METGKQMQTNGPTVKTQHFSWNPPMAHFLAFMGTFHTIKQAKNANSSNGTAITVDLVSLGSPSRPMCTQWLNARKMEYTQFPLLNVRQRSYIDKVKQRQQNSEHIDCILPELFSIELINLSTSSSRSACWSLKSYLDFRPPTEQFHSAQPESHFVSQSPLLPVASVPFIIRLWKMAAVRRLYGGLKFCHNISPLFESPCWGEEAAVHLQYFVGFWPQWMGSPQTCAMSYFLDAHNILGVDAILQYIARYFLHSFWYKSSAKCCAYNTHTMVVGCIKCIIIA